MEVRRASTTSARHHAYADVALPAAKSDVQGASRPGRHGWNTARVEGDLASGAIRGGWRQQSHHRFRLPADDYKLRTLVSDNRQLDQRCSGARFSEFAARRGCKACTCRHLGVRDDWKATWDCASRDGMPSMAASPSGHPGGA